MLTVSLRARAAQALSTSCDGCDRRSKDCLQRLSDLRVIPAANLPWTQFRLQQYSRLEQPIRPRHDPCGLYLPSCWRSSASKTNNIFHSGSTFCSHLASSERSPRVIQKISTAVKSRDTWGLKHPAMQVTLAAVNFMVTSPSRESLLLPSQDRINGGKTPEPGPKTYQARFNGLGYNSLKMEYQPSDNFELYPALHTVCVEQRTILWLSSPSSFGLKAPHPTWNSLGEPKSPPCAQHSLQTRTGPIIVLGMHRSGPLH